MTDAFFRRYNDDVARSGDDRVMRDAARDVEIRLGGRCRDIKMSVAGTTIIFRAIYRRNVDIPQLERDIETAVFDALPLWVTPRIDIDLYPF
jgi:hypothetical protein